MSDMRVFAGAIGSIARKVPRSSVPTHNIESSTLEVRPYRQGKLRVPGHII